MNKYCVEYSSSEILRFKEVHKSYIKADGALSKLLQLKKRFKVFNNISEADLVNIIDDVQIKKFSKKQKIIEQNSVSSDMFFILMGECEIFVDNKVVGYLKGGQVFGEVAAVFKKPRNATVVSSKPNTTTLSFKLNHKSVDKYPYAFVELYKNIANELTEKLESLNRQ